MKVSEVTVTNVVDYLKLDDGEYSLSDINLIMSASKAFIKSYTGLDEIAMDLYEDIAIVLLILCQDMYDNRSFYVDKTNLNKVVSTILSMHRRNFIHSVEVTK